jgi:anti-sigma B factor antagonist
MAAGFDEFVRWSNVDGVAVFEVVVRELNDPTTAQRFGATLKKLIAVRASNRMVLDFQRTEYMSSTGFGTLLEFARAAGASKIRIALCGLTPSVRLGANILSLGRFIPIFEDAASAVAALRPEPVAVSPAKDAPQTA